NEFSSTDPDTNKNISRKVKITRENCKRHRVISKAKQQDLDVELRRILGKGGKQPSVRSAQEELEEARDVTRPDISKIYEKNFQQSKSEESTSTPVSPGIHRLCTAFLTFILPPNLQQFNHVLDRRAHILFTQIESKRYEFAYFQSFYNLITLLILIKRSVLALEMNTFKDEATLNMSANFKTSMKKLKVMKKWIAEPKVETEIRKSCPTKHLLNQADVPIEKTPTWTGQEDGENDIKIINLRKLEAVVKKLSQVPKILKMLPIHNKFNTKVFS
ncbi:hypothetical protein HGM15179_000758, partial [Zosterops borbonicus]